MDILTQAIRLAREVRRLDTDGGDPTPEALAIVAAVLDTPPRHAVVTPHPATLLRRAAAGGGGAATDEEVRQAVATASLSAVSGSGPHIRQGHSGTGRSDTPTPGIRAMRGGGEATAAAVDGRPAVGDGTVGNAWSPIPEGVEMLCEDDDLQARRDWILNASRRTLDLTRELHRIAAEQGKRKELRGEPRVGTWSRPCLNMTHDAVNCADLPVVEKCQPCREVVECLVIVRRADGSTERTSL